MKVKRPNIIKANGVGLNYVITDYTFKKMGQREKLEETLMNLAAVLGIRQIQKFTVSGGADVYSLDDGIFRSASNQILLMSEKISNRN